MTNNELRTAMRVKDMKQWQLADALGVSVPTLTRWFRHELTEDQAKKVKAAVDSFQKGR